ncbi:hypothetical protein [Amycolatopsis sp. CA-230715]|uniref:hypothetical protein n=1 Tax=Amycolatopsis sp. CA-230715 TaxID=2745196 RepID=UPI001C0306CC|nr:hypothetical protein [Amycolatopsis sp. CA-230715]QWF82134.1 hypothetical protein HUW46_05571 [Amycolatopsis sp. CA-230715]
MDISRVQQHFEATWREPVQVTGLKRVTVGTRRDRRREREGGSLGCVGEVFAEIFANLAWPFLALGSLARRLKRFEPRRHAAIPSGPASGEAYRVAEVLKRNPGDLVIVRGRTRLAIATPETPLWTSQGNDRPQWSPEPVSLYWEDGSMLLFRVS